MILKKFENILTASLFVRSVFHSEADFQHHLAWHIHRELEDAAIRLEYPLPDSVSGGRQYCDILLKEEDEVVGVELKYKTAALKFSQDGEEFDLKHQGAQDTGRYDFLKDLSRLESWCSEGSVDFGFSVFLTNDSLYWRQTAKMHTANDKEFMLYDGRVLTGELSWDAKASLGTRKGREAPIKLRDTYQLEWRDVPIAHSPIEFRYLLVNVNK